VQVKRKREGKEQLNIKQRQWLILSKPVHTTQMPPAVQEPKNQIRLVCYKLFSRIWMDNLMLAVIILNVLVLAISWDPPNPRWEKVQDLLNLAFDAVYMAEVCSKVPSQHCAVACLCALSPASIPFAYIGSEQQHHRNCSPQRM
jgi:hypothetical protein